MKGITLNQLSRMCLEEIANGNGEKCIITSSDDECNEYHQIWTGLVAGKELVGDIDQYQLSSCCSRNISDYMVLV